MDLDEYLFLVSEILRDSDIIEYQETDDGEE